MNAVIFGLTEDLLAIQEGLSSVELINWLVRFTSVRKDG